MKVLVSDNISNDGVDILKNAGLEVDVKTGMTKDELKACIAEYNGIVIRSATKLTADVIDVASNLKVIGRAGSGLDNVDKAAASKKGIVVMNTPGGNTITTAEHTIAMLFALARNIPQACSSMKSEKWEKKKFMGVELFNKTLGIIGLGNIGKEVAKRAIGLQMQILAYDPFMNEESAKEMGVELVSIDKLLKKSDFVTLHTSLTPETKKLINKDTISKMKEGVRILNCARGGIVSEDDLFEAIKSEKVAGAALDVFEKEPPDEFSLISHDKLICTPHLGASTREAQENVAIAVAEQVVDYLVHGTIRNAVNFPSIPADQAKKLKPYTELAERMGSFASQIFEGPVEEINIEFRGEAADVNEEPVKISLLKGFLATILEETVNFVNAPFIAKERGIDVGITKGEATDDYHTMLSVKIKSEGKELKLSGTLMSKKDPRIIMINNFHIEIIPDGLMLYISNIDRPGVIGNIGMILGDNDINISRMHFGRETEGGDALSVVSVDGELSNEIFERLKALPNILNVKRVSI